MSCTPCLQLMTCLGGEGGLLLTSARPHLWLLPTCTWCVGSVCSTHQQPGCFCTSTLTGDGGGAARLTGVCVVGVTCSWCLAELEIQPVRLLVVCQGMGIHHAVSPRQRTPTQCLASSLPACPRQVTLCGQPGGDPCVQALNVGCCSWCAHILTVHACLCCAGPPCSLSAGTCMALPLAVVAAVVASLGIQGWGCINSWDPPGTPACSADVGGTTAGYCRLPTGARRAAMTSCTAGRCCCSCKWHLLCLGPFHLLYLPAMCGCCCCQNQ